MLLNQFQRDKNNGFEILPVSAYLEVINIVAFMKTEYIGSNRGESGKSDALTKHLFFRPV